MNKLSNISAISSQTFNSKRELQKILNSANVNLRWHESGRSELDKVFGQYDKMEQFKAYIMAGCSLLFWTSLAFDAYGSYWASPEHRRRFLALSRMTNFLGREAFHLTKNHATKSFSSYLELPYNPPKQEV